MGCRLSRIRFLFVRSFIISLTIILFLQLIPLFNNDDFQLNSTKKYDAFLRTEKLFWTKLSDQDKDLTDEQRIKQLEIIENQIRRTDFNWTNIFFDIYARKLSKINERDKKTAYKYRFKDNRQRNSQQNYEIYEETLVSLIIRMRFFKKLIFLAIC